MTHKRLVDILIAYADDLNKGVAGRESYLKQAPGQQDELEALLYLGERIKRALVPVQPSPAFIKDLAWRLTVTDNTESAQAMWGYRRGIFVGAAAVGSALSVIGLVAYLVRNRAQGRARVASTG